MNERLTKITASIGLLVGGVLGMLGSFAPTASLRSLAWGLDGMGLILASALLIVYYFRKGNDMIAAGFIIFALGESLILSSSGVYLHKDVTTFGAGTSLWATSLVLISFQKLYPVLIRVTGLIAAVLFSIVSIQIFIGRPVNALTQPLPYYAYPFFAVTILGWAWTLLNSEKGR